MRLWAVALFLLLFPGFSIPLHLCSPLHTHLTSASLNSNNDEYSIIGKNYLPKCRPLTPNILFLVNEGVWRPRDLLLGWVSLDTPHGRGEVRPPPELGLAPAALAVNRHTRAVVDPQTVSRYLTLCCLPLQIICKKTSA